MNEKRPLTFTLFLLRLLSGIVGGVAGTLALLGAYFLFLTVIPSGGEETSLSVFIIIAMAFLGTLTANTVTAVMVSFLDNEKYSRRKTIIMHVFLFNLILFFLTIPLYLLGISLDIVEGVAALHFLLSAFVSALIMEILAGTQYALLGVYGSALAIFISIGIAMAVSLGINPRTLFFVAMPATWFILEVVGGLTELIYDNFLKFYGVDALNVQTDLGGDSEKEPEEDEEPDLDNDTEDGSY